MSRMKLFTNIGELLSNKGVVKKRGKKIEEKDLSLVKKAALVVEDGKVLWVGKQSGIPTKYKKIKPIDLKGLNVFPGFVDCHTHLVFAGDRQSEFELRNKGVSYQEIANKGGGILSTMKATRKASAKTLTEIGQERINFHLSQGVTCVEVKSGYGLNKKTEEKMLEAAKSLKGPHIVTTYLGAHAIPNEFSSEKDYLEQLKKDLVDIKKKGLASRVDIFVEKGYFSVKAAKDYLSYAQSLGFDVTIHADQLNRTGATGLGLELKAQSLDHVICLNQLDKKKMAQSETVGVLLPTADFFLQCDYPDARRLIDSGGTVALATDFNPGSSPSQNIQFVGLLARLQMKMTLPEVFSALTYGGSKALGLENQVGALVPGYSADFFISSKKWQQFFYDLGEIEIEKTFVKGVQKHSH